MNGLMNATERTLPTADFINYSTSALVNIDKTALNGLCKYTINIIRWLTFSLILVYSSL